MRPHESILALRDRMSRSIIGQERVIERILVGLLGNGHLLVEGLPGLAKTRAVKSLAAHLDAGLSRIQFTPDLLPSDVTGTEILHTEAGSNVFRSVLPSARAGGTGSRPMAGRNLDSLPEPCGSDRGGRRG